MAVTAGTTWPNKEFHDEGFKKLPRGEKLKMSQWLLDKVMFPKGVIAISAGFYLKRRFAACRRRHVKALIDR